MNESLCVYFSDFTVLRMKYISLNDRTHGIPVHSA